MIDDSDEIEADSEDVCEYFSSLVDSATSAEDTQLSLRFRNYYKNGKEALITMTYQVPVDLPVQAGEYGYIACFWTGTDDTVDRDTE